MSTTPPAVPQPVAPQEIYGVFCGQIDQASVQRIFQSMSTATNPNLSVTHVHLLFQTSGGIVGDGVALHNFFKAYPLPLTIYNVGSVMSIGTIAYLGAKRRLTSAHALFQIHRSTMTTQNALVADLKGRIQSLTLDDSRTESILKEYLTLSSKMWSQLKSGADVSFSGEDAVNIGLATEIGGFAPPTAKQVYYI
jgi:ATP-dependent protease ClpP protease subunit